MMVLRDLCTLTGVDLNGTCWRIERNLLSSEVRMLNMDIPVSRVHRKRLTRVKTARQRLRLGGLCRALTRLCAPADCYPHPGGSATALLDLDCIIKSPRRRYSVKGLGLVIGALFCGLKGVHPLLRRTGGANPLHIHRQTRAMLRDTMRGVQALDA